MKALSLIPLLAVVPVLQAQEPTTHLEAALTVHHTWLQALQELTTILQGVKDKETADAAAPAVHRMAETLQQLQKEAAGFAPPTPAEEAAYKAAVNTAEIRKTVDEFMKAVITLAQAETYGSAALSLELENLLGRGH